MAARLHGDFRSGNLAENLGILLLRGIAAVADVPRTEDVGLDAVASLLRYDADGNNYAEDSFVVQLKAASTTTVEYKDFALSWFQGQELPVFIGRVSLSESRISLYPTLRINQAMLSLPGHRVVARFGMSGIPAPFAGMINLPWAGQDDSVKVWLGDPLAEWTLSDITSREWRTKAYILLKRFLQIARRERELLAYGQWSAMEWRTNDVESIRLESWAWKGSIHDIKEVAERSLPGIRGLLSRAVMLDGETGQSLTLALVCLAAALRDYGVDVDPDNLFTRLFALRQLPDNAATVA